MVKNLVLRGSGGGSGVCGRWVGGEEGGAGEEEGVGRRECVGSVCGEVSVWE